MKQKTSYTCKKCQYSSPSWAGQCPQCEEWNTMEEQVVVKQSARPTGIRENPAKTTSLGKFSPSKQNRIKTGIEELDRTVGGGFLNSSFTLLTGEPGIGKSTITLQIAQKIAQQDLKTLIISGEESEYQIQERANRLGITHPGINVVNESNLEVVLSTLESEKPQFAIIDSIQVIGTNAIPSAPGSTSQVRFCTEELLSYCKKNGITAMLIGHVTKDGSLAGPKTLEHLVDTVLQFEGDRYHDLRILRTPKNRFGSTNEIGIFKMSSEGLTECPNPSAEILSNRTEDKVGSILSLVMEGTRPLLIEVQALTSPTHFGYPKRTTSGYDLNRLNLLIAVLNKHYGIDLGNHDVFINITEGIRVKDPIVDKAVIEALTSSYRKQPIPKDKVAIGEISLTGEVIRNKKLADTQAASQKLGLKA